MNTNSEKSESAGQAAPDGFRRGNKDNVFTVIYEQVRRVPKGKVATYGMIAELAGNKKWSRVVGYALHVNPAQSDIPCHRIVTRFGETSPAFRFGGRDVQRELLKKEGVVFTEDGKVNMRNCLWDGL